MSPSGWVPEPGTAADLDAVLDVHLEAFPIPWSRAMFQEELDAACPEGWSNLVVARGEDDSVVGYVTTRLVVGELHIHSVGVRCQWRRRGVARGLVEAVIGAAERRNAHVAMLELRAGNRPARALYTAAGFRATALRPDYYTRPLDNAVLMERALTRRLETP